MRRPHALFVPGAAALVAVAFGGALAGAERADAAAFRLQPVASGLERALYVTSPPGDTRRLFVVQQTGQIRVLIDGRLAGTPVLDLSARVSGGVEQGLLGLAFHPRHAENGLLYVNYTDTAGDTRVVEYRVFPDRPNAVDPGSARPVIAYAQPFSNHNGGHLAFGPDGFLYIGSGDGGSGDPMGNGQRLDTPLGKILRIDVDGRSGELPYAIPPGNPFVGRAGARGEIYAYGLRNPWRFSFDRTRDDLWIGDVGQNAIEEIDFRPAGAAAGTNFGWSVFEGRRRNSDGPLSGPAVAPVAQYTHAVGCSVTGGYVYRGAAVPAMRGRYVYADFCSGIVFSMRAGPDPGSPRREAGLNVALSGVTSFGEDARGELYVVQAGGTIHRLAPLAGAGAGGDGGAGAAAGAGGVRLSVGQLRINQRIAQAAVRRVNALAARVEGRPPPPAREGAGGRLTLSAGQLLINQRISQAAVRRVNALQARVDGQPAPPRRTGEGGRPTLSARQLLINQRISQAAVRRVNALAERIAAGAAPPG